MGLYHKKYTVSTTYNNYNIENVGFINFNDFVYSNGNPLFIGSGNIYQLKSEGTFEYVGIAPQNTSDTTTRKSYLQFNNCIMTVTRNLAVFTATYSLDYGATWNTFEFNSTLLPDNTNFSPSYTYTFAFLNNCLGIYAVIRDGYSNYRYAFVYTNNFENVNIGYELSGYQNGISFAKINNNIFAIQQGENLLLFDKFDNYLKKYTAVGSINSLAENVIITTDNFSQTQSQYPDLFAYKYENGELTRFGPFTAEITSTFTLVSWHYYNNCIYKYAILNSGINQEIYKIDLDNLTEEVISFSLTTALWGQAKIVGNYFILGYDYQCIGILNLDNNEFFFLNKVESVDGSLRYVQKDKANHFIIYLGNKYTETISQSITPQERTKIYRNDYSTITGSQVLENAVRSVNHRTNTIKQSAQDIGSITKKTTITQNPIDNTFEAYTLSGTTSRTKDEWYYQQLGNVILQTSKPIIGEITADNLSISFNNKKWLKEDNSKTSFFDRLKSDLEELIDNVDLREERFAIDKTDLENYYNVESTEDTTFLTSSNYPTQIKNVQKLNDYTISFDLDVITRKSSFMTLDNPSALVSLYNAKAEIIEAQSVGITLNANSIEKTDTDFVCSIDISNGEYVQNNPLSRSDNELFSLDDTFFQDQANAIIQANKDGRMILTVNSTSDLNLYLGKELQVELKDGTLVNNGATFEVTSIKEKFTGINWKQTYTLKEKKSST